MSEPRHLVAVSLDDRTPVYWAGPFAKMIRHLDDIRLSLEGIPFDQFEIVLRVNKGRVTAMGPTPFRPDRWETRNVAGGLNQDLRESA